jgi:hypothetical protein
MNLEIILLLVIGLVFLTDFLIKGIKKKTSSTEVDIKKEEDQDFKNTDNKLKKKISVFGLVVVVVVVGIPISLIGSYLAAVYRNIDTQFLRNFRLDTDYTPSSLINSLIFFSIYLVFIAIFWNKIKIFWNNMGVLKYLSKRKKNITLLTLSIPILKITLHYSLYPNRSSAGMKVSRGGPSRYVDSYRYSIAKHIDVLFDEQNGELWLFIPVIIIILLIVWFFNDKIKAR